jgi:hypothetical protein
VIDFRNFLTKRKEVTDKESTLFRRLRCEKVALQAAGSQRSLRKSSAQLSAVSHQLALSIQLLNQPREHAL